MAGGRPQIIRHLLLAWVFIATMGLLAWVACAGGTAAIASAQARLPAGSHLATQAKASSGSAGHVTIIVLDMSGSMAQNDPSGVRCSAANGYIDLSGPGDYIGVIGLDNSSGARGGDHNFELAQIYAQPSEMATAGARNTLKRAIAHQSNSCQPDASTPTYDALAKALTMLESATHSSQITGSVIFLTDGIPDPDGDAQISAIKQDLVPKFKKNQWPIDSIALGTDQSFHGFLSDISNATSGKFYDDGNGAVPGVSPLNIAPFFVDIFARENGRVLGPTIAPAQLGGGTTSRDFQLADYVDHLDVIVVKDTPSTTITLRTSAGQTLPPQVAGTSVSTDPHYAIFSIDGPQQGTWTVNITGSGLALMDSLVVSSLSVNILAPAPAVSYLPLGQDFTVQAAIVYQGREITGGAYSVKGTLTYAGAPVAGQPPFSLDLDLSDSNSPGTYAATVLMPSNAEAGSYTLTISVSQVSAIAIAGAQRPIRFELFPAPLMLSSGGPTQTTVAAQAIQWDGVMQHVYGIPSGAVGWLSGWPLDGLPAVPSAVIKGVVELNGNLYQDATVSGTAKLVGAKSASVPVTVVNDGGGRFHVVFPTPADGLYAITFTTFGKFEQTFGDFGTTTRLVRITLAPPTAHQEIDAWLVTLLYLFLLVCILNLPFRQVMPLPAGIWQASDGNSGDFANARRRGLFRWYFRRNVLTSREAFGEPGLKLVFRRRGIAFRRQWRNGRHWDTNTGDPAIVKYDVMGDGSQPVTYTVDTASRLDGGSYLDPDFDEPIRRRRVSRRRETVDESMYAVDDDRPAKRRGERRHRKRGRHADDEYYED